MRTEKKAKKIKIILHVIAVLLLERADARKIPIIAMTADAFAEERKRTADAGMNAHLTKPIDAVKLYETLTEYTNPV